MRHVAVWMLLAGCVDAPESEEDLQGLVTPEEGGAVALTIPSGGEASVEVPAGAVTEATQLELAEADASELPAVQGGAAQVGAAVAFTPHGTVFDVPVTIELVVEGLDPQAMLVRLEDEQDTDWERVPATVEGDRIWAEVTSFSIYAAVAGHLCDQSDPDSDGDGLCDSEDPCPTSEDPDTDGDGICDSVDPCVSPDDDTDGNGICDGTEARISGVVTDASDGSVVGSVQVDLYASDQSSLGSTVTDGAGAFFFGGLGADTFEARVVDATNCLYGSGSVTVALGAIEAIDISAGCF